MNRTFKPKETQLIVTIVIIVFLCTALLILMKWHYINVKELGTSILTTCGIFIGFIISALGIYYSIPLRPEIKEALIKQGYYKQVSRNFIISILLFFVTALVSIISICVYSPTCNFVISHITNSLSISLFVGGMILSVATSINFFKIVTKN
jgi:protein-S-isoprenylcysteine O-methyltransferase Ste14